MRISISLLKGIVGWGGWSAIGMWLIMATPLTAASSQIDQTESCDVLVVGGGLAGVATAHESLHSGRTVCLTELTDWLGGQLTSQGTTALDEARRQRQLQFYAAIKIFDSVCLSAMDDKTQGTVGLVQFVSCQQMPMTFWVRC